ncbi:rho guanine nucleotide exchange factor 28-like isoform X3 [Montipora capricornis]|uniref:rho guanine nucleotide exchange factor 28-like isoform X3 n=1 Tax=Montipora capricornis TaxID=246305 RepID=UPI0035F1E7C4
MNSTKTKGNEKTPEACFMAFTPQSSPTRGGEVLFVTYSDDYPLPDNGDFYIVFEGKSQRHVTTAQQINSYTLRAIVPDHNQAERVALTIYCFKDKKLGSLSSHKFVYCLDIEQILAQLLADSASDSKLFDCIASLSVVSNHISKELKDTLDARITNAFEFLDLPPTWSLFGKGIENEEIRNGQETLLHLSARLGFTQLSTYLLDQPGSKEALQKKDKDGKIPEIIAREKGMKLLADMFSRGPGDCEKRTPKDPKKPQVKKSEIGTTTISSFKSPQQNSLEKDIEILQDINSLVEEEMKRRIPKFRHSWPVRKKAKDTIEDESSSDDELKQINRELSSTKLISQLNSMSPGKTTGSNRVFLEQNLKRLRDINEEIQKLRMVNSHRGSREAGRGGTQTRHMRRLSCPSLSAQDITQGQIINQGKAKEEKPILNGTVEQKDKKCGLKIDTIRTLPTKQNITDKAIVETQRKVDDPGSTNFDSKDDVVRWANSREKSDEERPGLNRRVSTSLDDLNNGVEKEKNAANAKSLSRLEGLKGKRPMSLNLERLESPKEEGNKLADILDSIKKASDKTKSSSNVSLASLNDIDVKLNGQGNGLLSPNRSNLHTKSYSYSCLADIKLGDDGNPVQEQTAGLQFSPEVKKKTLSKAETQMSLLDFLNDEESQHKVQSRLSLVECAGENGPESADDSEEAEKEKHEATGKGLRRFSMLFGNYKSLSKASKKELPKLQKGNATRSSLRKDKSSATRNKDTEDGKREAMDIPPKTALVRRASKPGETVTVLPNPGLLTRSGRGTSSRTTLSPKPTSPLPLRSRSFTMDDDNKERGKEKANFGVSPDVSGDDEDEDEGDFDLESQGDPELEIKEEPEAWSVTVDKKILKKMTAKDIKRQDVIHELIQTEVHHVRTLKVMHKIFYQGMLNNLCMAQETVDQMFPRLNELLQVNGDFLNRLKASEGEDTIVNSIGDVLEHQFSGENSINMKCAYGEFCSRHIESVELYKRLMQKDKKFADFMKKCSLNKYCRRLSIPECITLVTQRLTKYPMLIEAIVKTTKEAKPDFVSLKNSITLVKQILQSVDETIKDHEKQKQLQDLRMKLDLKVTVTYGKSGKKVKNIDLASNTSKLIHDGVLMWKTARGKLNETRVLIMEDMLVFLQEKDQKYSLLSLDQKAPVIRLKNLMVREVAIDRRAIFLVSTSQQGPEMYEIVCDSPEEKKRWMDIIREAAANAPEDDNPDDGLIRTAAGERRKIIVRRASVLIDQVQNKELEDVDRRKNLAEIQELVCQIEDFEKSKLEVEKREELSKTKESLVAAVLQVQSTVSNVEPLPEESKSGTKGSIPSLDVPGNVPSSGPKRAETFSGFDTKLKPDNINRASSMRVPERPGLGTSFPSRQLPATGVLTGESPKLKHKRKTSGGGWPFLPKSNNKEDKEQSVEKGDVASDSASSSPNETPSPSPVPGRETEGASDSDSATRSARIRPVRERSDLSPPPQSKLESLQSRLRSAPKEGGLGLAYISSPRSHRQARLLPGQDEGDRVRQQSDKSPSAAAAPDVIYF